MAEAVPLEDFEGPFDLLIELAQRSKVDLSIISLTNLTDKYLQAIQEQKVNNYALADFLVVASTLLLLKVKQLLPSLEPEEELAITNLSDRVRIYQLYRHQAQAWRDQWWAKLLPAPERLAVPHPLPFPTTTATALANTYQQIIERVTIPRRPTRHLRLRGKTLQESLDFWRSGLSRKQQLILQEALRGESKDTIAISFLAALELAHQQQITLHQSARFAPLKLMVTTTHG